MRKRKFNIEPISKEKGITLIALVITIIILIILATVTLNVVLEEGGLIQKAQQAKEMTINSVKYEEDNLANLLDYMNQIDGDIKIPEIEITGISFNKETISLLID